MNKRNKVVAVVVAAIVLGGSATAWALWSATGSGNATAKARTAVVITVNAVTGTADLYPGADGAVSFTLTNTNPYPVTFTTLTPGAITSSDTVNCPSSNVTGNTLVGLSGLTVAAGATSATLTVPGAVTMLTAAPDGCQGKTFNVAVTLTGSQS